MGGSVFGIGFTLTLLLARAPLLLAILLSHTSEQPAAAGDDGDVLGVERDLRGLRLVRAAGAFSGGNCGGLRRSCEHERLGPAENAAVAPERVAAEDHEVTGNRGAALTLVRMA